MKKITISEKNARKKLVLIASLLLFLTALTGCSGRGEGRSNSTDDFSSDWVISPALRVNDDLIDIHLTVVNQIERKTDGIELQLVNETEHTVIYGETFSIEFYTNGAWKVVPFSDDVGFIDIGYILYSNEMTPLTRQINWLFPDGLVHSGRYRLRMNISNDSGGHLHDLVAEFEIE